MMAALRLYGFELRHGHRLGLQALARELGWSTALAIVARMQWTLLRHPPFRALNARQPPTPEQRLSQHQMAPLVVLYQLLREQGRADADILPILATVSEAVAIGFLQASVPVIRRRDYERRTRPEKLRLLKRITGRFFNAQADLTLTDDDAFRFDVKHCHFAHYSHALGLTQLAPLFCQADARYFERHQPDVVFFRSRTLAGDQLPCDFRFTWRSP